MLSKLRPTVLFLCTADSPGGMERVVLDLTRQFQVRNWRARAVFPRSDASESFLSWAAAQGVDAEISDALLDVAAQHGRHDMLRLRALVRGAQPDVVNIHYGSGFLSLQDALAVRLAGIPRLYATFHQAVPWSSLEDRKKRMTGLAGRHLLRRSIAICEESVGLLREAGIPRRKIALAYCGVQRPTRVDRHEARAQLNLPTAAFVVLSVASLTKRKAIHELIAAASRVPDRSGLLRLIIAGDGPERAALESLAEDLLPGRTNFLGRVTGDMSHIYAAADVFALPSHAEGVPLVYHEAAMAGLPRIGTAVGGTAEAIIDGVTGVLFRPGDIGTLATALAAVRDSPETAAKIGAAAKARALELFTDTAMADRYESEFRS